MSFIEEVKAILNFKRALPVFIVAGFTLGLIVATIAS